jgi:hypothetical protein
VAALGRHGSPIFPVNRHPGAPHNVTGACLG